MFKNNKKRTTKQTKKKTGQEKINFHALFILQMQISRVFC